MNEREISYKIISGFENNRQRLDEIEAFFLSSAALSSDQIRHLKNVTAGSLRHRTLLDWYAAQLYKGKFSRLINEVKIIIRLGLYEIIYMDNIPNHATVNEYVNLAKKLVNEKTSKLVNAVLRTFIRERDSLQAKLHLLTKDRLPVMYSFPSWLIKSWNSTWGTEFTEELCQAFNRIPEYSVRINQSKITVKDFKQLLINNDVLYAESKKVPGFIKIKQIGRIRELGLLEKGLCSVQDESAGLPVRILNLSAGDTLLDVCAAPGGKFTQALEETKDLKLAVAVDNNRKRLLKVKENLMRLNLRGHLVIADACHLPFKNRFSKILIDAPCTGQGVIGKHPDIKWRRNAGEIREFSNLQKKILRNMYNYIEKSGQIVYSTCSIDVCENEDVIRSCSHLYSVLKIRPFTKIKSSDECLRTYPSVHKMDGSFACCISVK